MIRSPAYRGQSSGGSETRLRYGNFFSMNKKRKHRTSNQGNRRNGVGQGFTSSSHGEVPAVFHVLSCPVLVVPVPLPLKLSSYTLFSSTISPIAIFRADTPCSGSGPCVQITFSLVTCSRHRDITLDTWVGLRIAGLGHDLGFGCRSRPL